MKSVLEQTYGNIEYIVIDGGSTDGSKEYIKEHSQSLAYWVSEPDKGIYNAMNKGIDQATGEYLLFLNSGDWLVNNEIIKDIEPDKFSEGIISCNMRVVGDNIDYIKYAPMEVSFSFLYRSTLPHQASFIKRKLFEKVGYYNESLKFVADWEFFINAISKFNASYRNIDKVISIYNLYGFSSQEKNILLLKKERSKVLNTQFKIYVKDNNNLKELEKKVINLRSSKWINLLIRLGLINKF